MDEPFGALDPVIRHKAQEDLIEIQEKLGATIMLVTHDMDEAIRLGDRIAVMDAGRLVQYAPPAEIVARPGSEFVAALIGDAERPIRYLGLATVGEVVEPGPGEGPAVDAGMTLRDALSECLWSGRRALPVTRDGQGIGQVSLEAILNHARKPA